MPRLVGNSQLLVSTVSRKVLLVVLLEVVKGVYHVFEPVHVVSVDVPVPQVAIAGVLGVTHLKRFESWLRKYNVANWKELI